MQLSAMPAMLLLSMMLTTNSCKANKRILSYLILCSIDYVHSFHVIQREPSLLSLDTDGRVLRFDSFSKILSSG